MALACPACRKIALKTYTDPHTGLEIDSCPSCLGLWFDPKEIGEFFKSDLMKKRFFLDDSAKPPESTGYVISTKARHCPRCKTAMGEKLYGTVSVDTCSTCEGVWLDDGELQSIVAQFKAGKGKDARISEELSNGLSPTGAAKHPWDLVVQSIAHFFSQHG